MAVSLGGLRPLPLPAHEGHPGGLHAQARPASPGARCASRAATASSSPTSVDVDDQPQLLGGGPRRDHAPAERRAAGRCRDQGGASYGDAPAPAAGRRRARTRAAAGPPRQHPGVAEEQRGLRVDRAPPDLPRARRAARSVPARMTASSVGDGEGLLVVVGHHQRRRAGRAQDLAQVERPAARAGWRRAPRAARRAAAAAARRPAPGPAPPAAARRPTASPAAGPRSRRARPGRAARAPGSRGRRPGPRAGAASRPRCGPR